MELLKDEKNCVGQTIGWTNRWINECKPYSIYMLDSNSGHRKTILPMRHWKVTMVRWARRNVMENTFLCVLRSKMTDTIGQWETMTCWPKKIAFCTPTNIILPCIFFTSNKYFHVP